MNHAKCAVLWPDNKTLVVEDAEIENPRADEVLVKVLASGICHTDMVMRDQGVPTPHPVVLGHEGAGIIEKVGDDVTGLKVGDKVAMSFSTCGHCPSCSDGAISYCYQFFPLNFFGQRPDGSTSIRCKGESIHSHIFGQSSFATYAVSPARNIVKIDEDIPFEFLAPFGCGLQTGAGAVLNSLKVKPGSSVAVLGSGTVGMAAIMAAKIAGASEVIAIDVKENRLQLAMEVGATHTVNTTQEDVETAVKKIKEAGVDYVVDTTAYIPLVEQCIKLLAPRGTLGLVAAYRPDAKINFDVMPFMSTGLKIQGVVEGDTDIKNFIPQLIKYYQEGQFPIDKIIKTFSFDEINQAIESSETGEVVKAVVVMPEVK